VADLTYLLIPPAGLLHVFNTEGGMDVRATLQAHDGTGDFVSLAIEVDGEPGGVVEWFVNQTGPINERAREALAMLTGSHMIFTGPVMFYDVAQEKVGEVVARLSVKGG
jgi:hypothetical protein